VICGRCGQRMTVRYHTVRGQRSPDYVCQRDGIEHARPLCQQISGGSLDAAIAALVVDAVTPLALEVSLAVQEQLQAQATEVDRLRRLQVERARYAANLAERRFLRVDPDHRLVADSLEADWNDKLRTLAAAQEEYEQQRQQDALVLDAEQRAAVLALATDFPRLWNDPRTPDRERKRMLRLILEDVTLIKHEQVTAHVRFRGGATRTLNLPLPLSAWQARKTAQQVVEEVDRLLNQYTDAEVAEQLNQQGLRSGTGQPFSRLIVRDIRFTYGLTDRRSRLQAAGCLTAQQMTELLSISTSTLGDWRRRGLLKAHKYNDKGEHLYEHPGENPPVKWRHKADIRKLHPDHRKEV